MLNFPWKFPCLISYNEYIYICLFVIGSHMIIVSICEDNIPGPKFNTIYLLNKMWTRIYEEGLINEVRRVNRLPNQ